MIDFAERLRTFKMLILNIKRTEMGTKKVPYQGTFKYFSGKQIKYYSADTSKSTSVE